MANPASEIKQETCNQDDDARKKGGVHGPRKWGEARGGRVHHVVARSVGQEGAGIAQGDEGDATDHDA
jgi:hypothetical protein